MDRPRTRYAKLADFSGEKRGDATSVSLLANSKMFILSIFVWTMKTGKMSNLLIERIKEISAISFATADALGAAQSQSLKHSVDPV